MNMGKRIASRLAELGWKQKDLVDKVPDLTPQTLSNLVSRDSERSKWEREIAESLGVTVEWLVYGDEAAISAGVVQMPEPAEIAEVSALMRAMTPAGRDMVLCCARMVAAHHSVAVKANAAG